jgi:hypothetical protein
MEGALCPTKDCDPIPEDLPRMFFDPVHRTPVEMVEKLTLTVRTSVEARNDLVLKHMYADADGDITSAFYLIEEP